jgi:hypothetical protein
MRISLVVLALAQGRALQLKGTVSFSIDIGKTATQELAASGEIVVPLLQDFAEDYSLVNGFDHWVHVAGGFKDLVAARQMGAATVWLNEQAAADADDIDATGYIGASIIGDFADALCGSSCELLGAVSEARHRFAEREVEEEDAAARVERSPKAAGPGLSDERGAAVIDIEPTPRMAPSASTPGGTQRKLKYCMECGARLPVAAKFCCDCGEKQPLPEPAA